MAKNELEHLPTADLIPYARNARLHSDAQVAKIAGSLREFGFCNPVLIDSQDGIIAGHGRVLAALKLGMETVPCLRLDHLSDIQRRAYILADNRLALDASWDEDMLDLEIRALKEDGFDLDVTGFDLDEIEGLLNPSQEDDDDGDYSRKIQSPVYEQKGLKPKVEELFDNSKTQELCNEIDESEIPEDIKHFLKLAAERHTVFHFGNIAEYYAHAEASVQRLMEQSALIIIDFDQAIESGFVKLTEQLGQLVTQEAADAR